jgi:uncharacterized membrane protein
MMNGNYMFTGNKLWVSSIILSLIGLSDSLYLTWIKLTHSEANCIIGVGDCFSVNTSKWSEWNGIPIALIGAIGFLTILLILFLESRFLVIKSNAPLIIFGLTLVGVAYSAFLTYLEIFIINALCPYCLLSATMMLVLFLITIIRLVRNQEV